MKRRILSKIRDLNIKGTGRISVFLAKLLIPKPKGEVIVDTIYNFKLKVDPVKDNGVERIIYYFGTYEKGTLNIMDKILDEGDVFVDIGANIGLMSIFASKKVGANGKVIAFEPNPSTRSILESNIKLNAIENIKVESFALSDEIKTGRIYDRWDVNRGGASLIEPDIPTDSYTIEETTLSNYFDQNEKIKLIKIDVEGYELNVLKGAQEYLKSSTHLPILIVEFSSNRNNTFGQGTTPLFDFLIELKNYRLFKSVKSKEKLSKLVEITDSKNLPRHDNIFCFTNEHIDSLSQTII